MPNNSLEDKKGPAVKFPPPLIFIIFLLASYGLHQISPFGLSMPESGKFVGFTLVTGSLMILLVLLMTYLRAKTSIEPWKPTSRLITTGLYAYSRNPIYAAFCLLNIGIGCYLNSLWITLSFLPSALAVYYIAIRKEEAYLTLKFGTQYLGYKDKVRRWL